jgi:hypothetical protein
VEPDAPSAEAFAKGLALLKSDPEATWMDLVERQVMPASALLSPEKVLSFTTDNARTDLVEQFRAAPLGPHGPELTVLLWTLRSATPNGRYVLGATDDGGWAVLRLVGGRRPRPETVRTCARLEEAEWAVFALRWNDQTDGDLPLDREAP